MLSLVGVVILVSEELVCFVVSVMDEVKIILLDDVEVILGIHFLVGSP